MDEHTKERLTDFKDQLNRLVAHIESERDRIVEISKRLDALTSKVEDIKILVGKLDDILRNGGRGIVYKVGNLERDAENSDKSWHRWAAVLGGLSGAAALVIEILKN